MNKKRLVLVTLLLLCVGAIGYTSLLPKQSEMETVSISADWANSYDSISSMAKAADLVVVGTVQTTYSYNMKVLDYDAPGDTMVFSDYTIAVESVLSGEAEGKTIIVHQTGGIIDNTKYVLNDDPLLEEDMKVLLFLRRYDPGKYAILGGPQGQYHFKGEDIFSIGELESCAAETTKELHVGGVKISSIVADID